MEGYRQPTVLKLVGDLHNNWRKFRQAFEIYLKVSDPDNKKTNELRAATLLHAVGEEGLEIYNSFKLPDTEKMDYIKILQCFENHCKARRNVIVERYLFNLRNQHEEEPFEHFVAELKKMVETCEYDTQMDNMIRDRIVIGTTDKTLQERLLRISDLTLKKAIEIGRTHEASKSQLEVLSNNNKILSVRKTEYNKVDKNNETNDKSAYSRKNNDKSRPTIRKMEDKPIYLCRRCNLKHQWKNCPAFGKQCSACSKYNHFKVCCKNKKECKSIENKLESGSSSSDESLTVSIIKNSSIEINKIGNKNKDWKTKLIIEGQEHIVKLDTGAESNIITIENLAKLGIKRQLDKTSVMLVPWRGDSVKPEGLIKLKCKHKNNCEQLKFIVVKASATEKETIIGGDSCEKLGYIKRLYKINNGKNLTKDEFIKVNKELFEGEAKIKTKWNLKMKKDVPTVNAPRRVPMAIEKELKNTLKQLVDRKIIKQVDKPEGWVSNIVIKEKPNGKLRICLDPKELNEALLKESVLIPTLEELLSKIGGKKIFSVFDLREGFWQVGLDRESSKLCTFTTPFGTYRFRRLPFGLSVAPEIFQKLNTKNFEDIPNVLVYFDDLLIMGESELEHDTTVEKVLTRAKELGVKFNEEKIQYRQNQVTYIGYEVSEKGLQVSEERIQAIKELKEPKTKRQLQKFLGIVNYLRRFIPRMSDLTAPLRELLKKNRSWRWYPEHTNAINKLKQEIIGATTLTIYDREQNLTIQTDASKSGLGSCLMQGGRPLAFASRSLNETECGYAQVEKEMLAIVFAVQKFHYYIYGKKTIIQTDHKPLVSIFKKKIADINSNRLKRLRLKTVKYDVQVEHIPGKEMLAADLLSRDYIQINDAVDEKEEKMIHSIVAVKNVTKNKMSEIREETAKDTILKEVMEKMRTEWKIKNADKSSEIKKYWNIRKELSVEDDILLHRGRIVIPSKLREAMLERIHGGHIGIHKAKRKARELLYWPTMNKDIEKTIKTCKQCVTFSNMNVKEPMLVEEKPELPFYKIGADLLDFGGRSYLTVVDYYSNWIELKKVRDKTSTTVIKTLKELFSIHGVPQILRADNMPFSSYEFKLFAKDWDIQIITSSPRYPKSNGQAERAVGISKQMLKKSNGDEEALLLALMEYRNTPLANRTISPAQLSMGRRLRTRLPVRDEQLKPNQQINDAMEYKKLQERIRKNYNAHAKERTELSENDDVVVRRDGKWIGAKVLEKHLTPRSYIIVDENGSTLRRNKHHLKPTQIKFVPKSQVRDVEEEEITSEKNRDSKAREELELSVERKSEQENKPGKRSGRTVKKPNWLKDFVEK